MHSSTSSSDAVAAVVAERAAPRASAERATAADRPGVAQPVPERPIPDRPWPAILAGAFVLLAVLLGGWEYYWRSQGAVTGYRDDAALWAIQWRKVLAQPDATVLTGASRTFFDTQLPVWAKLSGRQPIQLAIDGTSPTFALEMLAAEPTFHGRVLVGIAPDIFFTGFEYRSDFKDYWRKESPSERIGKWLTMRLAEPWFAFFDPDFALFTVFARQPWPDRPGKPTGLRVRKLNVVDADRNGHMWSKLETDAEYREIARRTWAADFSLSPKDVAELPKLRDEAIARTVAAVKALRARGVPVLFVREPSVGEYYAFEQKYFPRATTWDVLLARTGAPGIHFEDYPQLRDGYELPEWSHMSKSSAERYTAELYALIASRFAEGERW